MQCNSRANGLPLVLIRSNSDRVVAVLQHSHRFSTEHAGKDFLRNLSGGAARICIRPANPDSQREQFGGSERPERRSRAPFVTFERPVSGNKAKINRRSSRAGALNARGATATKVTCRAFNPSLP